jgi:hypothetical protein
MESLFGRVRRLVLVVGIALASLAIPSLAAPVAQASGPSLYVIGQGGGVYVQGSGFTPGVKVRLELANTTWTYFGPTNYVTPTSCYYGGCFQILLQWPGYLGTTAVIADQAGWPTTAADTTIFQDPYITGYTQTGPFSTTFVISGSGYNPGATVTVQAWQWALCGGSLCQKVLSSQSVTASVATSTNADYGLIYSGNVTVPAHSGWVYVSTTGGASAASNELVFNIS